MAQATLDRVLEEIKTLQPEELRKVGQAVQSQLVAPDIGGPSEPISDANAWDVLEQLIGAVEAPADWANEHDHYLSGAPKRCISEPT
jgi:hypothetical protein